MNKDKKYPNLFIVGAPRSGTTFLHGLLASSPEIFTPSIKEPAYFKYKNFDSIIQFGETKKISDFSKNESAYLNLFSDWNIEKYAIDASTYYLAEPSQIAKDIFKASPKAKVIAILRKPYDRIISHHTLHMASEKYSKIEDFDIEKVLEKEEMLLKNSTEPWDHTYSLIRCSLYYEALKIYFKYFGKNFRVYLFDDLKSNIEDLMIDVEEFLDIENIRVDEKKSNKNQSKKFKFNFLNMLHPSLSKKIKKLIPGFAKNYLKNIVYEDGHFIAKKNTKKYIDKKLFDDFDKSIAFAKNKNILYEKK